MLSRILFTLGLFVGACAGQTFAVPLVPSPAGPPLASPYLRFDTGPLTLQQPAIPSHPFTVTGSGGAILGMQDGTVEVWQFPLKFFSGLHLRADVDGYSVPIDLNSNAAQLEVSPDHTTLTYSHAALTVRQHMFVPAGESNRGEGGVLVFEIQSIAPVTLTVSLTPTMVQQWPAPQWGQPGWEWKRMGSDGGAYTVATDNPELFGLIGMPGTTAGAISPYQEHPRMLPLEFRLRFDPVRDAGKMYPLLYETGHAGERNNAAGQLTLQDRMSARSARLQQTWSATQDYYAHFFDSRLRVHTPDARFDTATAWAELAIDKAQAISANGEAGLVAGWFPSFDSARPGFGWYFGRDTLWSMYAIDSYGDASLGRHALEFLIARQRSDGKMMHEFSQTADVLSGNMAWAGLGYQYAAADATPLYLMVMRDYLRSTGDLPFLRKHWASVQRAYRFERTHDSDGDGVYDNKEGTGWVESWQPRTPQQELYLAALDRDATAAVATMAGWMGDEALAAEAKKVAAKLGASVAGYALPDGSYAFSRNADGTYDKAQTVYPAAALWEDAGGIPRPGIMLSKWSSHLFGTDWGTRAVAQSDPLYNPISYHQGTVWPLFTGWNALAQYRSARPLAGYAALRQNLALTWASDPGAVTELLSGRFYQPLGRSSSHQLWSSAMVLAPAVRGLFGVEPDALTQTLLVQPQLPATWDHAELSNVRVGSTLYSVHMTREGAAMRVVAESAQSTVLCLRRVRTATACADRPALQHTRLVPLPSVEVELLNTTEPQSGDSTHGARVIDEERDARSLRIIVEAAPGSTVLFVVRVNGKAQVQAENGTFDGRQLRVSMPQTNVGSLTVLGDGPYITQSVTLRW